MNRYKHILLFILVCGLVLIGRLTANAVPKRQNHGAKRIVKVPESATVQPPAIKGTGEHLILKYKRQHVSSLAFSPNGKILAYGLMGSPYPDTADSQNPDDQHPAIIDLRDSKNGKLIHRLHASFGKLTSLAFSSDGKWIAAGIATGGWRVRGSSDPSWPNVLGGMYLWNVKTGKLHRTLTLKTGQVLSLAFSPDNQYVAVGSGDRTLRLWDISKGKSKWVVFGQGGYVSSVAFTNHGRSIVTANWDGNIRFWNSTNGKLERVLKSPVNSGFIGMAISSDGNQLVSGGNSPILLWNLKTHKVIHNFNNRGQEYLQFSPNAEFIAGLNDIRGGSTGIDIWKNVPNDHSRIMRLVGSAFTFTPDSKFLVMASANDDDYDATTITTIKYYKIGNSK